MQAIHRLLATRNGTIGLGAAAAGLAGLVLLLYLNQYRSSVEAGGEPVTVLVAKSLIEKGLPGDVIGSRELFQPTETPARHVKEGAITDPAALRGRVAASDVYPGQQLTLKDFTAGEAGVLGTRLAGTQRAIAVPLDSARGLVEHIRAGDRVDVMAGFNVTANGTGGGRPVLKVLLQNALVLEVPTGTAGVAGANQTSNVVLRTTRDQAAEIAWATDNGKVWVVLRPRRGAPRTKPGIVTAESLLVGVPPVAVYTRARKLFGGVR